MITSTGQWTTRSDRNFFVVPVTGGTQFTIKGRAGNTGFSFLTEFTGAVNNQPAPFCSDFQRVMTVQEGRTYLGVFPSDCTYLCFNGQYGPDSLVIDEYDYSKPLLHSVRDINNLNTTKETDDPVAAIMKIAESYFDVAYDPDDHLVYVSEHGPFSSVVVEDDYDYSAYQEETEGHGTVRGKKAIVCSQFSQVLIAGIDYANSRFVTGNESYNRPCWWGFVSDGTGNYVNDAKGAEPGSDADSEEYDPDEAHGSAWREYGKDYMSAGQQYQYFLDKGLFHPFDADHNDMKPGDLVYFWASLWNTSLRDDDWVPGHRGNESGPPETIDYISHVVICVRPYDTYMTFIHSNSGKTRLLDGYRAGVMFQTNWQYNSTTPAGYVHIADIIKTFPKTVEAVRIVEGYIGFTGSIPSNYIKLVYTIPTINVYPLQRGFYTLNANVSDSVTYYVNYYLTKTVNGEEVTYNISVPGKSKGGRLSIVFYAEMPFKQLALYGRGDSGTEFFVEDYVLYKGYHGYDK